MGEQPGGAGAGEGFAGLNGSVRFGGKNQAPWEADCELLTFFLFSKHVVLILNE